jgi:hypothetical protein
MLDPIGLAAAFALAGAIIGYLLGKSSKTREEPPPEEPAPIVIIGDSSISIESPIGLAKWRQNPSHLVYPKGGRHMEKIRVNGSDAKEQPEPARKNRLQWVFECAGEKAETLTLESDHSGEDITLHSAGLSFDDPGWIKRTYTWVYRLPIEKVVVTLEKAGGEKVELARGEKLKVEVS